MKGLYFKNDKRENIFGIISEPDKSKRSITLIIHGFSSNSSGKKSGAELIAKALTKNKLNSLRIDLDDMGKSEPKFESATLTDHVKTTESGIKYCKGLGYKRINIIGTSTGGITAMVTALKHPELSSLILRSPSTNNDKDFTHMFGKDSIRKWKKQGYIAYTNRAGKKVKLNYEFYKDGHKYNMLSKVKNIKIPTLILQGTEDKSVSPKNTQKMSENFPNATLIMIKGADHGLGINGDYSKSQNAIIEWIRQR